MPICPLCESKAYPVEAALADGDLRSIPDSWLGTELEYVLREAAGIDAATLEEDRSLAAYLTHRLNHLMNEKERRAALPAARYLYNPRARIEPTVIQKIRDRLPLERVIGQVLILKRSGNRLQGHCPFHEDWNPSLFVYPDNHWWCFQCETGGDVFDWLMSGSSPLASFADAVKVAAQMAGVSLESGRGLL